jgi:alpha-glucosidase (family GH31 glycosyl hydrolase)
MKVNSNFILEFILLLFLITNIGNTETIWKNDKFKIDLENNEILLFQNQSKFLHINSFAFNFIKPVKIEIKKIKSDTISLILLFNQSDGFHKDFPKEIPLMIIQNNNTFHFTAHHKSFNHITIQLTDLNEHYFGLIEKLYPQNSKNPDLRGNVVDVDIYSAGARDYAENYASAYSAFYISSLGYGSFFDTFAKGRYHLAIDDKTDIYHQTDSLDWYIFYGPTGDIIHKQYYDVIGKPKYVPVWACGPMFWRDQNDGGKDEILSDIQKFTELEIPLTACWVDRPYSHGGHEWSKMDFTEKFSEPEKWIKKINEKYNMQFMTWVGSLTFSDADFPGLLPNYKGYMDLTNPDALMEFERRLQENQYSVGVKGHKMDRADENFPLTAKWHKSVSESETRNKYVFLYAKIIDNFLKNAYGKDQFNFARAAFHRTQPFLSAIWGGDNRPNWQGMAGNQANAMRCGFMGFPMWGGDTGGYLGEGRIDEQLYIRWLQLSAWSGMFEVKIDGAGGRGEDRPPWKYSDQLQKIYRNVTNLRMKMLPYIYSCANTSDRNGVIMKPLAYMYPDDENTYSIWDEYIFGNAFLIAPVFSENNNREVYLPKGQWYDLNSPNKIYSGSKIIKLDVPIQEIPVFIKENSIYITGDIFRGNSKIWKEDVSVNEMITIHLYPGQEGTNTSFDYIDYLDKDNLKKMILQTQTGQIQFTSDALNIDCKIKIKCQKKPDKVLVNNEITAYEFDSDRNMIYINIKKDKSINLEIII